MKATLTALRCAAGCAATAAVLAGCATVPPTSTVPPTGWPSVSSTAQANVPSPSATPSATVTNLGVSVPVPAGYTDATDLIGEPEADTNVALIAFLRGPGQHQILVQQVASDRKDLDTYIDWYVGQAKKVGSSVTHRAAATMGGKPAVELTLKGPDDATPTTTYVSMPTPGTLVTVTGARTDAARYADVRSVAEGLTFE